MKTLRRLLSTTLLLVAFTTTVVGQTVSRVEYYWDTDPGRGNGTPITGWSTANQVNINTTISTAGLSAGIHTLGIRSRSNYGMWSPVYLQRVVVGQQVSRIEYFYDTDPGFDQGTAYATSATGNTVVINNAQLTAAGISDGYHRLGIRARAGTNGMWSPTYWQDVLVNGAGIAQIEYFYDTDPGMGQGIAYTAFTSGNLITVNNGSLNATGITNGYHRLGIRARSAGDNGLWSPTYWQDVLVNGAGICAIEYYWDGDDPGIGQATPITGFTPATQVTVSNQISTAELTTGVHQLAIRARTGNGMWSPTYFHTVFVGKGADYAEYYWDDDPGFGQGTAIPFISDTVAMVNLSNIAVPTTDGLHVLNIRARAGKIWSPTYRKEYCIGPTPHFSLMLDSNAVCQNEQFIILDESVGATASTHYHWDFQSDGTVDDTTQGDLVHTFTQEGVYTITLGVGNTTECQNTFQQQVTVRSIADPTIHITNNVNNICEGTEVVFIATTTHANGYNPRMQWYRNGTAIAHATRDTLRIDTLQNNDVITASVRIENSCNQNDSVMSNGITMHIYSLPEVTMQSVPYIYTDETAFLLTNRFPASPVGGVYTINGNVSNLFNPRNNTPGRYEICYTYTNSNHCSRVVVDSFELCLRTSHIITAVANDESMGSTTGSGIYVRGTVVTLTATPTTCHHFVQWSDGNSENPRSITVMEDVSYTAVFAQNAPLTGQDVQVSCDSYVWIDGNTYTQSNNSATFNTTSAEGCDSVVTLQLTINHSQRSHVYVTNCGPYTWSLTGQTYNKSGMKFNKGTTPEGCLIRDTLELTVHDSPHSYTEVTNCGPYTWSLTGQTYTTSGVKYRRGTTANGCPIRDTLNLTILDRISSHTQVTNCGPYTWDKTGQTYNKSGMKFFKGTTPEGCPIRDTLVLTVLDSPHSYTEVENCGPYTWSLTGQTYNKSGLKFRKGTTVAGCPIRDTLSLTVTDRIHSYTEVENCGPYTWDKTGQTYNKSGMKFYKGTMPNGCLIRDTLELTITDRIHSYTEVTNCGPYTWNLTGQTYNKSGLKFNKGVTSDGCLIRDTLVLTVVDRYHSYTEVTNCGSYTWDLTGQTYNKSGLKFYKGTAPDGCPIRDTLKLTVVDRWSSHDTVVSCDGTYTWDKTGQTYKKTGMKFFKGTANDGCPIRDTLYVIISQKEHSYTEVTNCGPYTWDLTGQTYNKSGLKFNKTTNEYGCPVRDTLNLTVLNCKGNGDGDSPSHLSTLNSQLSIYPNPTTGLVYIEVKSNTPSSTLNSQLTIEVLDLVGRRVAMFENTNTLDLSHLADGTYTLRITMPEGVALRKVVKR